MTAIASHPFGTVSWFDLMSPNPEQSRAFYGGLFGWTYEVGGEETGGYAMAQLGGKTAAGIGRLPKDAPYPSCWTAYFNVENAVDTAMAIIDAGGAIAIPVMQVMDAGRFAVAIDPSGAPFGLWQPGAHLGAQVANQHGAKGWQECHTRDGAKASAFYAEVFALEPSKVPGMEYWIMKRGEADLCGVFQNPDLPAQVPPHWLVYFDVDDTDATIAQATSTGATVIVPATDTPHGRMAVLADPFSATFAVIHPPTQ